jgi:hypothetical protein
MSHLLLISSLKNFWLNPLHSVMKIQTYICDCALLAGTKFHHYWWNPEVLICKVSVLIILGLSPLHIFFHFYSSSPSHVAILFTPVFTVTVFATNILLTCQKGLKREAKQTVHGKPQTSPSPPVVSVSLYRNFCPLIHHRSVTEVRNRL